MELRYDLSASLTADPNLSWAHRGPRAVSSHALPPWKLLIQEQALKASLGHGMLSSAEQLWDSWEIIISCLWAPPSHLTENSCAKVLVEGSQVQNFDEWLCWLNTYIK